MILPSVTDDEAIRQAKLKLSSSKREWGDRRRIIYYSISDSSEPNVRAKRDDDNLDNLAMGEGEEDVELGLVGTAGFG